MSEGTVPSVSSRRANPRHGRVFVKPELLTDPFTLCGYIYNAALLG